MTHPSKVKGNKFERDIVNKAKELGLESKRAYASNGESLGMHAEVDLIIEHFKIQAKIRKSMKSLQHGEVKQLSRGRCALRWSKVTIYTRHDTKT
mgnify:CR=1 FL=1